MGAGGGRRLSPVKEHTTRQLSKPQAGADCTGQAGQGPAFLSSPQGRLWLRLAPCMQEGAGSRPWRGAQPGVSRIHAPSDVGQCTLWEQRTQVRLSSWESLQPDRMGSSELRSLDAHSATASLPELDGLFLSCSLAWVCGI